MGRNQQVVDFPLPLFSPEGTALCRALGGASRSAARLAQPRVRSETTHNNPEGRGPRAARLILSQSRAVVNLIPKVGRRRTPQGNVFPHFALAVRQSRSLWKRHLSSGLPVPPAESRGTPRPCFDYRRYFATLRRGDLSPGWTPACSMRQTSSAVPTDGLLAIVSSSG